MEKNKSENPPAFNTPIYNTVTGIMSGHKDGMTLRDYFAAKAMHGELSCQSDDFGIYENDTDNLELLATKSYAVADAMLKERSKP